MDVVSAAQMMPGASSRLNAPDEECDHPIAALLTSYVTQAPVSPLDTLSKRFTKEELEAPVVVEYADGTKQTLKSIGEMLEFQKDMEKVFDAMMEQMKTGNMNPFDLKNPLD